MNSSTSTSDSTVKSFSSRAPLNFESKDAFYASLPHTRKGANFINLPPKYNNLLALKIAMGHQANLQSAVEMCVTEKAHAVESHDYYKDPFSGDKRLRNFTEQTSNAKKQDPIVCELITSRKDLKKKMTDLSISNLKNNVIETMIAWALEGKSFEELPVYIDKGNAPSPLIEAYNILKNSKKVGVLNGLYEIPLALKDLVDFTNMGYEQFLQDLEEAVDPYKSKTKISKCSPEQFEAVWKDSKDVIIFAIEEYWSTDKKLSILDKKILPDQQSKIKPNKVQTYSELSIREFFQERNSNGNTPVVVPALLNILKTSNISYNKDLPGQILTVIDKYCIKLKNNAEHVECLKIQFKEICESDGLKFIASTVERINLNYFDMLIKEQRQHSLARFNNIFNNHTAFINTVAVLGKIGQKKYGGEFLNNTTKVVAQLLEYSHIQIDTDQIKASNLKEIELEKLSTVHQSRHRDRSIMGYEKKIEDEMEKKLSIINKNNIINTLNVLLGNNELTASNKNKNETIVNLQRSHTLPFPACFSWKIDKEIQFINEAMKTNFIKNLTNEKSNDEKNNKELTFQEVEIEFSDMNGLTFSKIINNDAILFSRKLFKQILKNRVSPHTIEDHFSSQFEKLLKISKTKEEFLFQSLELIKNFYIRLFSETELFPDFINQFADAASEWSFAKDNTYKVAIAGILKNLVETEKTYQKSDVVMMFKPYLENTAKKLEELNKDLDEESTNSLIKKICLYQVEETIRIAVSGQMPNLDFIQSIFTKSLCQVAI